MNEKDADDASDVSEISEASVDTEFSEDDELCVQEDKFLIFTTGSNTYSPHQIGEFKLCVFFFLFFFKYPSNPFSVSHPILSS